MGILSNWQELMLGYILTAGIWGFVIEIVLRGLD